MEDLNKQQIVLLTLLVSFVTSIATGITTVSLVSQYETPTVTQTINRVVEKTIERVVPENENPITTVKTPEKEIVTVVVKEEDLTIDSIQANEKSLVRVYEANREQRTFVTLGLVVSGDGSLMTNENFFNRNRSYVGVFPEGEFELDPIYQGKDDPILIMRPILREAATTTFVPVIFGEAASLQLGQTVLSLGGTRNNEVSNGIIKSFVTNSEGVVTAIQTTIPTGALLGSSLINLKGEVVGMNLGEFADSQIFTSVEVIQSYIAKTLAQA